MWRSGDYDNLKDAILDVRGLLANPPASQRTRIARLERMLSSMVARLRALARRSPDMADYARGLLDEAPAPSTKGTKRRIRSR
jgi:hypothetical protein